MRIKLLRFIIYLIALGFIANKDVAQSITGGQAGNQNTLTEKWTTNPFDPEVFIENNGQFDGKIESEEKILYGVQMGRMGIFFTANKVIYRYDKNSYKQTGKDDPDDTKNITHEVHFLSTEWAGANPSVSIVAKDEKADYYTYGKGQDGTIKANIFKEIIYKNLYPGIDVVYRFIKGKGGIKYDIIVHPGADLSKIKLEYAGAKNITKNEQGDLLISSELNVFTEHAPVSNYENIKVSTVISGNTESFKVDENYDKSKTLVIDPWITNPMITPVSWNKAFDLDWDYKGNVYAYGGEANSGVLQLVKINSAGTIIWTFNANGVSGFAYGDFCTNKTSGTSYLVQGGYSGRAIKVNANGSLLGTYGGSQNMNELWRVEYDVCNSDVVIGGGGTGGIDQAGILDTDMSSINMVNVMGVGGNTHDVALLTIDPNGTQCYMASLQARGDVVNANNVVMKLPLPSLSPTAYEVHERLGFIEEESILYAGYTVVNNNIIISFDNGMNGAAASSNWLYLYNGDTLRRYNKNTGAYVSGVAIRDSTPYQYGGLDVDGCDNLFVGVEDSVYVMDSAYSIITKFPFPGTVYDVRLGQKGALYACGVGFVAQLVNPVPPVKLISSVSAFSSSCACNGKANGKATVNLNCGYAPFKFSWSDGSTNQTDTGLCQGTYTVTVTDGACPPTQSDSAVITIRGDSLYTASITAIPDTVCQGDSILLIGGGGGKYFWSNGKTNDSIYVRPDSTSTISMLINASGCLDSVSKVIFVNKKGKASLMVSKDTICEHDTTTLTASGGTNYIWNNNSTANTITVSPDSTRTYTVISAVACAIDTLKKTIYVTQLPIPAIQGRLQVCSGSGDTLTAGGGTAYLWSNGSTSSSYILNNITGDSTISLKVFNGACYVDTTLKLVLKNPKVTLPNGVICQGQCDTITAVASGSGNAFSWSNGDTSSSIVVCPTTDTTLTVSVSNGCVTTATTNVSVEYPQLSACCDKTISPGGADTIQAGKALTYSWAPNTGLNCTSCATVIASPTVTTTYTVTGTDSNGCELERVITVNVEITCKDFKVPNVFTPDNGGIDEAFFVDAENVDMYSIIIYDRWGKEMYKSPDPKQAWDGNSENGGPCPAGVYYYIITSTCQSNSYKKDGFVQLIR